MFERLGQLFRSAPAPTPPPAAMSVPRAQARTTAYESAATSSGRAAAWRPPSVSATASTLGADTIRTRCRDAVRNDAWAKAVIDTLTDDLIGWGVKPMSRATDEAFRQALQQRFEDWTAVADADGLLDFYGLQATIVREWLAGGECFVRLRPRQATDGLPVPLQLQVLPAEACPPETVAGNLSVRDGIEFDAIGRRTAYYLRDVVGGEVSAGPAMRVPASQVLHIFEPLRPGQRRGIPALAPALVRLHELDKYADATLLRLQISNLIVGTIQRTMGTESHPLTGLTEDMEAAKAGAPVTLEPGALHELRDGESLTFNDPPDPPAGFSEFVRHELRAAGAAVGVPLEVFTHDWGAANDRIARVILNQYRRRVHRLLWSVVVPTFLRPVWREWFKLAVLTTTMPMPKGDDVHGRVTFAPHAHAYVHPVQDIASYREAILAGLTSRQAAVAETGEDVELIDAQQAADNARADKLRLTYTSDARAGGAQ